MPTHIRRAGPADAQRLAEVHVEAWHETYTGLVRPGNLQEKRMVR